MKLDKKQLPQLVVLGVLVLACVGYVSFTVPRPKQSARPPKPVAEARQKTDRSTDVADSTPADADKWQMMASRIFPDLMSLPARRDPFTPQTLPNARPAQQQPSVIYPKPPRNATGTVPPINPFTGGGPGVPSNITVVPERDPEFVLTGTIRGDQNVAIIRAGTTGRYIVRRGQLIDGRYRVLSVSEDGVVLAHKNRRMHVKTRRSLE